MVLLRQVIPRQPPVCSAPPPMRFCKSVVYPVYRPSAEQTFAQLDFDSHAVFKKIVPHMRISERSLSLPSPSLATNEVRKERDDGKLWQIRDS